MRKHRFTLAAFAALCLFLFLPVLGGAAQAAEYGQQEASGSYTGAGGTGVSDGSGVSAGGQGSFTADGEPWRIRFLDAAVVQGENVLLGEVAAPMGQMPAGKWDELAGRVLWPSPPTGKAMNMTRPRLQEAVMATMRDLAPYCLFPGSMAIQRGGVLVGKQAIQQITESSLRPYLSTLPGESMITDFRLPQHIFLTHQGQRLELEPPKKLTPGRVSIRLVVKELDGSVKQRFTGSVFANCYAEVPCASVPMNRDDLLEHTRVTFKRMDLATLRSEPWDGRGGPWRLLRPIGVGQVIYKNDVGHIPTVRKGSMVTMVYESKSVRLTVQAQALADGATGEVIQVRNMQSKKEVYAEVRDATTVVVRTPSQ